MSAVDLRGGQAVAGAPGLVATRVSAPAGALAALRFELVKLFSSWRTRVLIIACLLGPGAFIGVVSTQTTLPSDTVFGRWMLQSGWAGALVLLSFSCTWVFPLLTSLVAGDVFAVEDRLGTWRQLLMSVRSPGRIFWAKATASVVVILLLAASLAVSSIVGGLLAVGNHDLVGLGGQSIAPGQAARLVVLAWACAALATLAYAAIGLLGSVALGGSPVGLFLPAVVALLLQMSQMLPLPAPVRFALPSQAFVAWRGLFAAPRQVAPLVVGLIVCALWTVLATSMAWFLFRRRDFTDVVYLGSTRRILAWGLVPLVALTAASAAALSAIAPRDSGVTRAKVQTTVAQTFAHLYRLQTAELHRPDVTEAQMAASAACAKGDAMEEDAGPGTDWHCTVNWHIPGATATGNALYQVDVQPDGRIVADGDGPKTVNGYFTVRTAAGTAANPLWQIDSLVDLLASSTGTSE